MTQADRTEPCTTEIKILYNPSSSEMPKDHSDQIDPTAQISPTAVIGNLFRPTLSGSPIKYRRIIIGPNVFIGHHAVVGQGSWIGERSVVDDLVKLEPNVAVGKRTLLIHRAYLSLGCVVGDNCVVGGFLTDRTQLGSYTRVFGNVVHSHPQANAEWDSDDSKEGSAVIEDECFVGFGAQVIGAILISKGSYIAANAIVTRDVPPNSHVTGVNQIKPRRIK